MTGIAANAQEEEWHRSIAAIENNPQQVIRDNEQALQSARQKGDKAAQVKALRLLSQAYLSNGDLAAHRRSVDEGEPLAQALGDANMECWFLRLKFQLQWHEQQYKEATALFDKAMNLAREKHLDSCLAFLYATKGINSGTVGRTADGIEWLSKAYALFQSQNDRYYMAKTLADIATIVNDSGPENEEKSLAYLRQALALIGPEYRRSNYGYNRRIGMLYLDRQNFVQAERYFQTALLIANQLDSPFLIATIDFHFGDLFQQKQSPAEALRYFDLALPPASRSADNGLLIRCQLKRAEVLSQLSRNTDSLRALASARQAIPQPPSPVFDKLYHESAADVYMWLGQYQEAFHEMKLLREAERRLTAEANARLSSELEVRFDMQRREAENAVLRAQQREAESKHAAIGLAMAMGILLLGGLTLYLRKRTAEARQEAEHQRTIARAETAANQAKDAFLANMSHELRSPLNTILGFARLVSRNPEVTPQVTDDLGVIVKSGEHLYTMINQVLDLSKIQAEHATFNESLCDLHELLDEMTNMFTLPAAQKDLQLTVEVQTDVPQYIRTDTVKLRQILINLLGNAVKFTAKGWISLKVGRKSEKTDSLWLSFKVTDTGPGIAPGEQKKLGQAFVQAEAGKQAREGTGLGLALCNGFAQVMKGNLSLSTQLGRGTTVQLDVPAIEVDAASMAVDKGKTARNVIALAPNQPRYRILVADDMEEGRKLLMRLLEPLGFEVREAGNGREALAIWAEWEPHLIWMDMRMPVMNGREATRHIKATPKGHATIIIALTASSFEVDRAQILADGCDDFLRKPYRESDLFELMHKHLGVKFIYDEPAASQTVLLTKADLAVLPQEMLTRLEHALRKLDISSVEHAIRKIQAHDASLARKLEAMAKDFQYNKILELMPIDH